MAPFKIYICVEIATRELRFKKEIKEFLANKGYNVELGYTDYIIDGQLSGTKKAGVTIVKSIQKYTYKKLLLLKAIGSKIVYLEEEAWVPFNNNDLTNRRLSKRMLDLCDLVLAPNRYFYELIKKTYKSDSEKLIFFGSNRMTKKTDSFNVKKFNSVLAIGSYGALENKEKYLKIFLNEIGGIKSLTKRKLYKKYFDYWERDRKALFKLIFELSKNGYNVSYRPHPNEIKVKLPSEISSLSNNKPIIDEAKKFDLVIHSGSSSTFEIDSPNVISISGEETLSINSNSKNHGPIIHSYLDLEKVTKSKFGCIYNDDFFVNKVEYTDFLIYLGNVKIKEYSLSPIIFFLYKNYIKYISKSLRDNNLIKLKLNNIKDYEE